MAEQTDCTEPDGPGHLIAFHEEATNHGARPCQTLTMNIGTPIKERLND
jgi:hypothetical protein